MAADPFLSEDFRVLTPEAFDFVLNNELKRAVRSQNFLTLLVVEPMPRDPERVSQAEVLREVARVLVPGGQYLLQTPNKWTNTVFETIRWRSFTAWRADHCALHSYRQIIRRFGRHGFTTTFYPIPVVTDFFRWKVRRYLGAPGLALLAIVNPDRLPMPLRTNFYIKAVKGL